MHQGHDHDHHHHGNGAGAGHNHVQPFVRHRAMADAAFAGRSRSPSRARGAGSRSGGSGFRAGLRDRERSDQLLEAGAHPVRGGRYARPEAGHVAGRNRGGDRCRFGDVAARRRWAALRPAAGENGRATAALALHLFRRRRLAAANARRGEGVERGGMSTARRKARRCRHKPVAGCGRRARDRAIRR